MQPSKIRAKLSDLEARNGSKLIQRDRLAIIQAAQMIRELSATNKMLSLKVGNLVRMKTKPISAPKVDKKPRRKYPRHIGRLVRDGANQAEQVAHLISGVVDLYRVDSGIRVVKAGVKVKGGEYLGRFNEGATWQDIKEAIE